MFNIIIAHCLVLSQFNVMLYHNGKEILVQA